MIINLLIFSGVYVVKMNNPNSNFLDIQDEERLLEDKTDEDGSHRKRNVSFSYDMRESYCSEAHAENIEQVRSLSFV